MPGPAADTEPEGYTEQVRECLESTGASLDMTHVLDTVYLLGGTTTGEDGTSETAVFIIVAGPQVTLEKTHLRLARKAADKYDADRAKAHARGGARDEIVQLCETHDIHHLSQSELFDTRGATSDDTLQQPPTDQPVEQTGSPEQDTGQQSSPPEQNTDQSSHQDQQGQDQSQQQDRDQPEAQTQTPAQQSLKSLPIIAGIVRGGLSYLLSLILVVGMYFREASQDESGSPEGGYESLSYLSSSERTGWEAFTDAVGWVHINAHTVPITITTPEETATLNMLELIPVQNMLAYHAAPAAILFVFGYGLAHKTAVRDAKSGFKTGVFLVVGYSLLTAAGAVVFRFSVGEVVYKPPLIQTMLIAGCVYPIASGGLGGAVRGFQSQAVVSLREVIHDGQE